MKNSQQTEQLVTPLVPPLATQIDEVVVIDFETTGLSPQWARPMEVGLARVVRGEVVETLTHLMNPGHSIPFEITTLTGITTAMVRAQPRPEEIFPQVANFIGSAPLVAHNAAFDQKFFQAECTRASLNMANPFLCTLLLTRRMVPGAPSYRLGSVANFLGIATPRQHRALDDVLITAKIWAHIRICLIQAFNDESKIDIELIQTISKRSKKFWENLAQLKQ